MELRDGYPPLAQLAIVSFLDEGTWPTRLYGSQAMPRILDQVFGIIGERFGTKGRRKAPVSSLADRPTEKDIPALCD